MATLTRPQTPPSESCAAASEAPDATHAWLRQHFSQERMVTRYADVILNAKKLPPLNYRIPRLDESARYKLAPWCYVSDARGLFHDFRGDYTDDAALLAIAGKDEFPAKDVNADNLRAWLDEGYVVPVTSSSDSRPNPDSS